MKALFFFLAVLALSVTVCAQKAAPGAIAPAAYPAGFLENYGQVRDFNNKPVESVYFQANLGGQQVFITRHGLSLLFSRPRKITRTAGGQKSKTAPEKETPADSLCIVDYEMERIDITLKDASILPDRITTKEVASSPLFYLYFDERKTNGTALRLKNEILVKDVYPGIDWKIYIKEQEGGTASMKYDFIVHPGADPSRIQLRYSGNVKLELSGSEIKATANMGQITEEKPYSYIRESGMEASVRYEVEKNTFRFRTGNYDKSRTLVIDPTIFWLTYLTSTKQAWQYQSLYGNDVETDAEGNIIVQMSAAGNVPFPTVNPGGGAYYQNYTASPNGSMVISKFAPGGQLLWSTYFGNWVGGRCMTVDKSGNIITIGRVLNWTPSFPNPDPSIPLLNSGGYFNEKKRQFFIAKFSKAGVLSWSSWYLAFNSYPMDMSYDVNGNVYVTGWSTVYEFPVADPGGGAYVVTQPKYGWAQVLFIAQFDAADNLKWSTRIEGQDYDPVARVCTDKLGNIYVGGQVRSSNYPTVNAGGYFNTSGWGSVITRFNPARQMTWSTYFPGAFTFADLTTDDSCNLYVIADRRILKFDSKTQLVFTKSVNTNRMHFWQKINYDPFYDQIQLLGVMNDATWDFPTVNTACNGSFYDNGRSPQSFFTATDPIFATINHNGDFSYRSLADWGYEYYDYNEMTIDPKGNPVYLFGNNQNGYVAPNPQLTDPGNGAYFDRSCCYASNGNLSSLLLKLTASDFNVTTQVTQPTGCDCNGIITVTPQCGQTPFTYRWSNGAATATVTGLCPGNYSVNVTDANNLSRTISVTISPPPGSISSLTRTVIPENCNRFNGSITVRSVLGGTSPYSYSVDGKSYGPSSLFAGLDSGSHIVRVRDANGCSLSDTVLVPRVKGPSAAAYNVLNSTCKADDGQLQVTGVQGGIGPYQYTLGGTTTNSTGLFTGLAAGSYMVTVSDTAGCRLPGTVVIGKTAPPSDAGITAGNDHCNQGIGFISVTGVTGGTAPYTFSVDSTSFAGGAINNLYGNNYTLFIKDANGCLLKMGPVTVGKDEGPASMDITVTQAYCGKQTGSVLVHSVQGGSAPYTYSVDKGTYASSSTLTNIAPGLHELSVKDAYGCMYSQAFRVDFKPVAVIALLPADTTVCFDEPVPLTLSGDVELVGNIQWNIPARGHSALLKADKEKKIIVTATDRNNCIVRDTAIVRVKACSPPESCLLIPTAFTPNHDGRNETFRPITNGCRVKSISFRIFNRWGEPVFSTDKPGDGWNGMYKRILQPADVYVFICNYTTEDGVHRQQKGTLMLIR